MFQNIGTAPYENGRHQSDDNPKNFIKNRVLAWKKISTVLRKLCLEETAKRVIELNQF